MSMVGSDGHNGERHKYFGFWNSSDDLLKMAAQRGERNSKQELTRQLRISRSKFRRINSLDLIPEHPGQESGSEAAIEAGNDQQQRQQQQQQQRQLQQWTQKHNEEQQHSRNGSAGGSGGGGGGGGLVRRFLLFWPNLAMSMLLLVVRYIVFIPLSIAAPSFWLSALLWIFWKLVRIPISCIKSILNSDALSVSSSISSAAQRRTVLISCGSTIQTLHLARNFYSSGVRVVVFEFEGLFGLARFSTAVDKFYVVPRPTAHSGSSVDSYITALCQIVNKEKPSVYIPVCATSPAYYDALAKPSLELLGCASFIPGLQETVALDDCLQFYQKCAAQQIALPPHAVLSSTADLMNLYTSGFISSFRNILMAVGMQGLLERYKYILPNQRRDFKFNHDISDEQPWMVVRDMPGDHYVTCTTVKESHVVANVTCRVEIDTKNLVPVVAPTPPSPPPPPPHHNGSATPQQQQQQQQLAEESDEVKIDNWLRTFFARVRFQRPINGHISFRLVKCQGEFLPLGVRLGVSLPYICYNRSHAQVLCRTMKCIHMKQLSLVNADSDESTLSALSSSWRWSAIERSSASAALDKREALFAYWDPLPYCAYYHFQLPLESVKLFLQRRHRNTNKTLSPRIVH